MKHDIVSPGSWKPLLFGQETEFVVHMMVVAFSAIIERESQVNYITVQHQVLYKYYVERKTRAREAY